jgi:hypothetical protein
MIVVRPSGPQRYRLTTDRGVDVAETDLTLAGSQSSVGKQQEARQSAHPSVLGAESALEVRARRASASLLPSSVGPVVGERRVIRV